MPFSELDQIPWNQLTHAYGTAEDVPQLLRALQSDGARDALSELFGNIWHQGTVYEATSYAVPFLLELAADASIPEQRGVVELLGAIAGGSSYLDVHEDFLNRTGVSNRESEEHLAQKAKELQWVSDARAAVAKGTSLFVELSKNGTHEIRFAAAEVLANLSRHLQKPAIALREMLDAEQDPISMAALMLLLLSSDLKPETDIYFEQLTHSEPLVRRAATLGCLVLEHQMDSPTLHEQMVEAILDLELESRIEALPVENGSLHHLKEICLEKLTDNEQKVVFEKLCCLLEQGDDRVPVELLLDLCFGNRENGIPRQLTHRQIDDQQRRVLRGLIRAIENEGVFLQSPWNWGLPESRRNLQNLVDGKPPITIDDRLPLLGYENSPSVGFQLDAAKVGDRLHHRKYGNGTITSIIRHPSEDEELKDLDLDAFDLDDEEFPTQLAVQFDEEGARSFSFDQENFQPPGLSKKFFASIRKLFEGW